MENLQKLVEGLQKSKVPSRVKELSNGEVWVELGFNYPDELYFTVTDIAEGLGMDVEVCAETSERGKRTLTSCGGPRKSYFR
jgi:hypothetical protein